MPDALPTTVATGPSAGKKRRLTVRHAAPSCPRAIWGGFIAAGFLLALRPAQSQQAINDTISTWGILPTRWHQRARSLAAGCRQHAVAATRRLRCRGDQGRGPRQG